MILERHDRYAWQDAAEPKITAPNQALVRPLLVACCDLDVAVAQRRAPMAPGHVVGHEGVAEVVVIGSEVTSVRVGDRVIVPFQINCGACRECRRGATGSCSAQPLMAMYGMAPLAGLDCGGFMADVVHVPHADAMLVALPDDVDPVSIASLSDNIPDGWRTVGPHASRLLALDEADRRVLVMGKQSIGLYAAAFAVALGARVDYLDTDVERLTIAERLGAVAHERPAPGRAWRPYPIVVHTTGDRALLLAAFRATWADGVCTDTGIYFDPVEMPLLSMYTRGIQFSTGRVSARAAIPAVLELLARGVDVGPVVDRVVPWDDAPEVWASMCAKTVFSRLS